jgi:membrane protein implicated in regulation of membrane protease activity
MAESRKPLLTKPAGVFVQIVGLLALLPGLAMLAGGGGTTFAGVLVVLLAISLFWIGRQTQPREP